MRLRFNYKKAVIMKAILIIINLLLISTVKNEKQYFKKITIFNVAIHEEKWNKKKNFENPVMNCNW